MVIHFFFSKFFDRSMQTRQLLFDEVKYCHPGSWTPALGKRKTVSKREQCPVCEENWNDKQFDIISHFPEHCKTLSWDDASIIQVLKRMLFIVVSTVKEFPANVQTIGKKGRNTQQDRVLFRSILTTWDLDEAYIFEELQVMNKTATNKANNSESLEKSR